MKNKRSGLKYVYDYSKLKGRIKEKCDTQSEFAKKIKLSETSVINKLNNKVPFTQYEIFKSSYVLDIPMSNMYEYFFIQKVEKNSIKESD